MEPIIHQTLYSLWRLEGIDLFCNAKEIEAKLHYYLPAYNHQVDLLMPAFYENAALALTSVNCDQLIDTVYRYAAILINKYGLSQQDSLDVLCTLGSGIYGPSFEEFVMRSFLGAHSFASRRDKTVSNDIDYAAEEVQQMRGRITAESKFMQNKKLLWFFLVAAILIFVGCIIQLSSVIHIRSRAEQHTSITQIDDHPSGSSAANEARAEIWPVESKLSSVSLISLSPLKSDGSIQTVKSGVLNTGEQFSDGLIANYPYREIVYQLDGRYALFSATWALTQRGRNSIVDNTLEIFADGRKIYGSQILQQGNMPYDISVDISGCRILSIMFEQTYGDAVLANPTLTTASTTDSYVPDVSVLLPVWLPELNEFASSGKISSYAGNYVRHSNTGKLLAHTLYGTPNAWKDYYLDGKYQRLSGVWTLTDTGKNTDSHYQLKIYADQEVVYVSPELSRGMIPVLFDVSIKNCQLLRMEFSSDNQWGNGEFVAANLRLYAGDEEPPAF